jgi:hypothetical protein
MEKTTSLRSVLLNKYHSGAQIKKTEMGRACGTCGRREVHNRALVGKPERRRALGRRRLMWEDNIKMDLQEVRWVGVEWIGLAQNRDW